MCTLGTKKGSGDPQIKVDFDYPLKFAKLALKINKNSYFAHLSSKGASSTSMMNFMKIKGQAEDELIKYGFKFIQIYQPGLLTGRDNDQNPNYRISDFLGNWMPFLPKFNSSNLATLMVKNAVEASRALNDDNSPNSVVKFSNE